MPPGGVQQQFASTCSLHHLSRSADCGCSRILNWPCSQARPGSEPSACIREPPAAVLSTFVTVSSKFRIMLATVAQAASSATSSLSIAPPAFPSPPQFLCASSCSKRGQLLAVDTRRRAARLRQAAAPGQAESKPWATRASVGAWRFRHHPPGQPARRFDIRRVVQQHQRLQRRVRRRAANRARLAVRGRRKWSTSAAAKSASRTCTSSGDTDPRRARVRPSPVLAADRPALPQSRRLRRKRWPRRCGRSKAR